MNEWIFYLLKCHPDIYLIIIEHVFKNWLYDILYYGNNMYEAVPQKKTSTN